MANLKELKIRINSVKSTQKITSAMKVVSAAKLKKAKEASDSSLPYANKLSEILSSLAASAEKDSASKLLVGNGKNKTHLIIVLSSDRGLCGAFNAHLVKKIKQKISVLQSQNKLVKIVCIGRKGYELLKYDYQDLVIDKIFDITKQKKIPYSKAQEFSENIIKLFEDEEFDSCSLFFNKFITAISQEVTEKQLIPLDVEAGSASQTNSLYEYEPSKKEILNELLPKNIAFQIYSSLLENSASEHGARMSAMDNASRNAGDMIKKLTLVYNRTRQAAITTELIEIIAGAEAV